ncbi:unnamed protein product [Pleuronectes platessa]|uniref:Uncharacterized protein n=1 Tax=Pleuronectes platessa TaxID=8262 RepID=A0A9N7V796_PLEPL|nr:unnamed protein product [Pleuronectes platessa]
MSVGHVTGGSHADLEESDECKKLDAELLLSSQQFCLEPAAPPWLHRNVSMIPRSFITRFDSLQLHSCDSGSHLPSVTSSSCFKQSNTDRPAERRLCCTKRPTDRARTR